MSHLGKELATQPTTVQAPRAAAAMMPGKKDGVSIAGAGLSRAGGAMDAQVRIALGSLARRPHTTLSYPTRANRGVHQLARAVRKHT